MSSQKIGCMLVHGWGMNHRIWQPVVEKLSAEYEVCAIDLPGHGQRSNETFGSLQSLTEDLKRICEQQWSKSQPRLLVGWSLGALPCLELARQNPGLVDGLLLVSSNPCFVRRDDWDVGVDAEVFDQFAESLKQDFSGTIRRFLSLQVKGSESGRQTLRALREKVLQQAQPHQQSLDAGLEILKHVDLRDQLSQVQCQVSWALGGQDGLVRAQLATALQTLMPSAEVRLYSNAGHAPFLSHTDEFVEQLKQCSQRIMVERDGRTS